MTYGPAKRRDIARSVLPAKAQARKGARTDLAAANRHGRRAVRQELLDVGRTGRAETVVDRWDGVPISGYPSAEIALLVRYRRRADKLGPVFRWAIATTKDLPIEDRLPAVRRVLDGNLAGRHAVSHLERDAHFEAHPKCDWFLSLPVAGEDEWDPMPELRAAVIGALEHGHHGELNRLMKSLPRRDGTTRTLAGRHDVDDFIAEVCGRPCWLAAIYRFRR